MIMFNSLSQQIYQRYPQATGKVRNWDYDSLEAITRRGSRYRICTGRESHPARGENQSVALAIDLRCCLAIYRGSGCGKIIGAARSVGSGRFSTLPAYRYLLGASDTRALDDVLQEMGHCAISR